MDTGRASAEYAPVAPPVHSEAELELQTTRGQSSQLESCTVAPTTPAATVITSPLHYGGGAEVRGLFNPMIRLLRVLALPGRIQPRIFFLTSRSRLKATRPLRSISSLSLFKDDARRSRQRLQSDLDRWSSSLTSIGFYKQQLYCRQKISSCIIAMFHCLHSVTIICSSAVILLPGEHIALACALRSLLRHLRPLALRSGSQADSTNCVASTLCDCLKHASVIHLQCYPQKAIGSQGCPGSRHSFLNHRQDGCSLRRQTHAIRRCSGSVLDGLPDPC